MVRVYSVPKRYRMIYCLRNILRENSKETFINDLREKRSQEILCNDSYTDVKDRRLFILIEGLRRSNSTNEANELTLYEKYITYDSP